MGGTGPPRGSPRADPGAARTQLVRVAQGYVSYWLRGFGASGLRGFGASGLRASLPNVTGDGIRPTSAHHPFSPDLKRSPQVSTVAPFVAVSTTVCPNRRPPRPKHPKFTQFHRSGLHFGRIHPQHRQYGDSSKAYGDCRSVRGRRSLAGHRKRRAERSSRRGRRAGGPIRINHHDPTGVEGAGGSRGQGGRTTSRRARPRTAIQRRLCGGRRRVRRARAAGPDGTWNTSGA